MVWLFLAIPVIGMLAILIIPNVRGFINVNKCLDNGGSYNYETCKCDFKESHEYKEKTLCK